jgi:hypothetical protein
MLVYRMDERSIDYDDSSPFAFEEHPMRPKSSLSSERSEEASQVPEKISIEAPTSDGGEN